MSVCGDNTDNTLHHIQGCVLQPVSYARYVWVDTEVEWEHTAALVGTPPQVPFFHCKGAAHIGDGSWAMVRALGPVHVRACVHVRVRGDMRYAQRSRACI